MKIQECREIFNNLLQANDVAKHQNPCAYIRELEQTVKSDEFYDFSKIRRVYALFIGVNSMKRIMAFHETSYDEKRATQAIFHYNEWTNQNLIKALSWKYWIIKKFNIKW